MINNKSRIEVIFSQIDKLASKGGSNIVEYQKYVDLLSTTGDYDNLLQCLYFYYDVNVDNVITIEDIKTKTWDKIMFRTENVFTKRLKKLYNEKGIYQIAFNIYNDDNVLLGQIQEDGVYTDEARYYIKNREYARITGTRKTFLRVTKDGEETIIDEDNLRISEDNNLYNRYVIAVNLLLS